MIIKYLRVEFLFLEFIVYKKLFFYRKFNFGKFLNKIVKIGKENFKEFFRF